MDTPSLQVKWWLILVKRTNWVLWALVTFSIGENLVDIFVSLEEFVAGIQTMGDWWVREFGHGSAPVIMVASGVSGGRASKSEPDPENGAEPDDLLVLRSTSGRSGKKPKKFFGFFDWDVFYPIPQYNYTHHDVVCRAWVKFV